MVLGPTEGTDGMPGPKLYGMGIKRHLFFVDGMYKAILTDEHE